jgi:broad specificity phosphatase PhoE
MRRAVCRTGTTTASSRGRVGSRSIRSRARTLGAIHRLTRVSPGEPILLVGYGGVNRISLSHFRAILPKLDRSLGGDTNISVVRTDGKTLTVERLFAPDHVK